LGVAATKVFIMYTLLYKEHKRLKKPLLKTKWNHLEFLVELFYDFIEWSNNVDVDNKEDNVIRTHYQIILDFKSGVAAWQTNK
jgi:hypothetical protein